MYLNSVHERLVDEQGKELPVGVIPAWQQLPPEAEAKLARKPTLMDAMTSPGAPLAFASGLLSPGRKSRLSEPPIHTTLDTIDPR